MKPGCGLSEKLAKRSMLYIRRSEAAHWQHFTTAFGGVGAEAGRSHCGSVFASEETDLGSHIRFIF